jgi:hypothetical protein
MWRLKVFFLGRASVITYEPGDGLEVLLVQLESVFGVPVADQRVIVRGAALSGNHSTLRCRDGDTAILLAVPGAGTKALCATEQPQQQPMLDVVARLEADARAADSYEDEVSQALAASLVPMEEMTLSAE